MTIITLPIEIEAWAESEVQAGAAESVEVLAIRVLEGERQMAEFRATLDAAEAEADEKGWIPAEEVFAKLKARYSGES